MKRSGLLPPATERGSEREDAAVQFGIEFASDVVESSVLQQEVIPHQRQLDGDSLFFSVGSITSITLL